MKRSNIIIISAVILFSSWLMLSVWLQGNAFNVIKSGKSCSYANIISNDSIKRLQLHSFKNIKIDFEKSTEQLKLAILYSKKQEFSCSNGLKRAITYSVSGDTLYLSINYLTWQGEDFINIGVPSLVSVTLTSDPNNKGWSSRNNTMTTISGFIANTLFINNNSKFQLQLNNNQLKKLELKGDLSDIGNVEITDFADYDSLDVDIQGKHGTLSLKSYNSRLNENQKQWISIKVPRTFRIEADASIFLASKITIKK